jgi:hypothetical protein
MSEAEPRNELEQRLHDAQEGRISSEGLLEHLLTAQVFMPVQDEPTAIRNFQRSTRARPLVLSAEDGTPVLVLFSSPDRAKPFVGDFPGYGGGLLVEFKWILEKMGTGYAIALNPGSELGFDMEPQMVGQLVQDLAAKNS